MPLPHLIQAHPALLLAACAAGALLAIAYLAADYLVVPSVKLRRAMRRGPGDLLHVLERERERVVRLRAVAAVHEEHDHPGAAELREEAELRSLLLRSMERRTRRGYRPR